MTKGSSKGIRVNPGVFRSRERGERPTRQGYKKGKHTDFEDIAIFNQHRTYFVKQLEYEIKHSLENTISKIAQYKKYITKEKQGICTYAYPKENI